MTGWDILNNIIKGFPPVAATLILVALGVVFIIGFSKYGYNFLKYGFTQREITDLGAKIDELSEKVKEDIAVLRNEVKEDIVGLRSEFKADIEELRSGFGKLETELAAIKVNHFGHLKNFLTELTSILVDRGIINNENKARLDNHLREM